MPVGGGTEADPYANDPGRWGASLATLGEVLFACLDVAKARAVVEVGAYAGDLSAELLRRAERVEGTVAAIDPDPQPELSELAARAGGLELIEAPSLHALKKMDRPDAVVLDGDHNYYTVSEELRLVASLAGEGDLPLILLHDACWPHARRDTYYTPEAVPAEARQPIAEGAHLYPGITGVHHAGLPYKYAAAQEGGERNGVATAIEDFVGGREGLRYVVVPAFFGLGVVWPAAAPYDSELGSLLEPLDRNPVLERLEANRVLHLASSLAHQMEAHRFRERSERAEHLLRKMLESKAFVIAERISRWRQAGEPLFSREEIQRVLADDQ